MERKLDSESYPQRFSMNSKRDMPNVDMLEYDDIPRLEDMEFEVVTNPRLSNHAGLYYPVLVPNRYGITMRVNRLVDEWIVVERCIVSVTMGRRLN
jgi:hypothetical protein